MIDLGYIDVRHASARLDARRKLRNLAVELGFDAIGATRLATAVSEAVRVLQRVQGDPHIRISLGQEPTPQLVLDFISRHAAPPLEQLAGLFDNLTTPPDSNR